MDIHHLHDWNLSPTEAVQIQKDLSDKLIDDQPLDADAVQYVAGVDVSVKDNVSQAAVVVMSYPDLELVETVKASMDTPFPYVPGLLTFREGPVLVKAFEKLKQQPDVFIFDGMGRIHPRRMGIAAHMGLWLQRPTIGVGKTHLIGDYGQPGALKGSFSWIHDRNEIIGAYLRTRSNVKPVYVSVGHLAEINDAINFVLTCTPKYKLPRPIRLAHDAAGQMG